MLRKEEIKRDVCEATERRDGFREGRGSLLKLCLRATRSIENEVRDYIVGIELTEIPDLR